MLIVGAHMSIANGFLAAVKKTVEDYHANSLQIFLKSPRGRGEKPLNRKEAEETQRYVKEHNIKRFVAHCSYLLNFAKDCKHDPWPQRSLISDLQKIHLLGGDGVVLHIGKMLDLSKAKAYQNIKVNIMAALEATQKENNWIMLENTAGQGSEIGFLFEDLAELYHCLEKHPRIRFCFDTQHAFAAGYDMDKQPEKVIKQFEQSVGKNLIALCHFNDSKKDKGTRVDRHEHIGKGKIGRSGLEKLMKMATKYSIPLVLETPSFELHKKEIAQIKTWT